MAKESLDSAKSQKQDEFYTKFSDIKKEVQKFGDYFMGQRVICPCNDYKKNFYKFFKHNFNEFQLKKLIAVSHIPNSTTSNYSIIRRGKEIIKSINGDGSFDSYPVQELIQKSDVVVTNPPFSLFDEFLLQVVKSGKDFLILGPFLAATHKQIFPLFQKNKVFVHSALSFIEFVTPDWYEEKSSRFRISKNGIRYRSFGNICWFTNIESKKKFFKLTTNYAENEYQKYDNYPAIEIPKLPLIPKDYLGIMGVPITFLNHYHPDQFEIVGFRKGQDGKDLTIGGKSLFSRILIKKKPNHL